MVRKKKPGDRKRRDKAVRPWKCLKDQDVDRVLEMARLTDTPAPSIEAVYGLTKLLDQTRRRPKNPRD